jgi:defect-in-organelle-trafficking protein DotD
MVATPDSVTVRLADAADKAADALQSLSSVEQYRTPAPAPAIAPIPTDALASPLAVDWTGPIEPLLKRLAARTAYQYKTQGSPPAAPIDVTVNVADQPIIDTLRDIGLQAGSRANLTVDSNAHVIQLTYGPQIR